MVAESSNVDKTPSIAYVLGNFVVYVSSVCSSWEYIPDAVGLQVVLHTEKSRMRRELVSCPLVKLFA
jgi:hypothetical protein